MAAMSAARLTSPTLTNAYKWYDITGVLSQII